MSNNGSLIAKDYIFVDRQYKNTATFFEEMGRFLYEEGYVKESYVQALKQREIEFPTGLETPRLNIAIPHTEASHVVQSKIVVVKLKDTLPFHSMGGEDDDIVDVGLIFLLAIADPKEHLETLQKIISILSEEDEMEKLKAASSQDELYNFLFDITNNKA